MKKMWTLRSLPRTLATTAVFLGSATACTRDAIEPTNRVRVETSRGTFVIELRPEWSPRGVARFKELVEQRYFDNVRFFRIVPGFVAQFGMHGDPAVNARWKNATIPDEPVAYSNLRGTISFATSGPNTRSNQLFINLVDNPRLDGAGFSPIGRVVEGMGVIDGLYSGYGEAPNQTLIAAEGNAYLNRDFPRLDYIRSARFARE